MWMGQQRLLGHEVRRLHAEFTTVVQFRSPRSPLRRPCASGDDARCVPVLGRAAPPEAHAGLLEPDDGVQFGSPLPFSLFVSPRHFSIKPPLHGHPSPCTFLPRSYPWPNASLPNTTARWVCSGQRPLQRAHVTIPSDTLWCWPCAQQFRRETARWMPQQTVRATARAVRDR